MIRPDLAQIPAYVPGTVGAEMLKLSSNEMTLPPLPAVQAAVADCAARANRYPDMGAVALREALAGYLGLDPAEVAVGCGSTALCQQLIQATCAEGDEVIFAWRSFEAYPILARVAGATPVPVPLDAGHRHDLDAMAAAITGRTRLIFVCNPNNPTGTTLTAEELEGFLAKVPGDVVVALDEAYLEFADGFDPADPAAALPGTPNAVQVARAHRNVVGLRTFSKVWGLAGLRVGYLFGDAGLVEAVQKVAIPFSVNAPAQAAALACLAEDARAELLGRVGEVAAERERLTRMIAAAAGEGAVVPGAQGNFLWIPEDRAADLGRVAAGADPAPADAAGLEALLAARGVLVRCFPGEGIRVTVTSPAESDRLLAALGLG
ncbi:aminotransferase [Corynebacterium sphenisci DSM 44792]|uniref:Aromatic amino acid aminotransferase n=1 Tax=Corynebacterium sphenisci DSM 44792 TaxID=1437874 RepID=A0A1L7CVB2_9CORY|nr:histidinol-phosphate transaminase [Corynebacterium sphenisci]APT89815.1 aminotransferase [Corynebacterium sphenisci DSM 44792]